MFDKFSSFHLSSEVLDLKPNYVSPTHDTQSTKHPFSITPTFQLTSPCHNFHSVRNTSTLLLRFTPASFLRQHFSLVPRLLRPALCTHVSWQMALCREFSKVLFCLFLLGKPAQREGARTGLRSYARCSTLHYPERPER